MDFFMKKDGDMLKKFLGSCGNTFCPETMEKEPEPISGN